MSRINDVMLGVNLEENYDDNFFVVFKGFLSLPCKSNPIDMKEQRGDFIE